MGLKRGFGAHFYFGKFSFVSSLETESLIHDLARESAEKCGFEFVHLEVVGKIGRRTIRVFIDKEDGVNHDDCVEMSRQFESALDRQDPIEGAYTLEVSSPGIERGLYKISDFERFAGDLAKIKTHRPIEGQRNFAGYLKGVDGNVVEIDDRTRGITRIDFDLIRKANLEFDVEKELRQGRG